MGIEVQISSIRGEAANSALASFARNTVLPDLVTIVTNELAIELPTGLGFPVRVIGFWSDTYPIGGCDLALRRNIGLWLAQESNLLLFDDDQLAPRGLVAESAHLLAEQPYFYGHHRFISFSDHTLDEILALPPRAGRAREQPPNAWHLYQSCYASLMGVRRDVAMQLGGFDLLFLGRCANEDQNFGRRLARKLDNRDRVFIYEPPFAWHPTDKLPYSPAVRTNLCGSHLLERRNIGGVWLLCCRRCPFQRFDDTEDKLFMDELVIQFEPSKIRTSTRWYG